MPQSRSIATAAVAVLAAGYFQAASAVPIVGVSGEGADNARTAEQAYLGTLANYRTETFESFSPGLRNPSIGTTVGNFELQAAASGGMCARGGFSCEGGPSILNDAVSPFWGRSAAPVDAGNTQWLDSMDARSMLFTPADGVTSLGFYLTDANDFGGRLTIAGTDFLLDDLLMGPQQNGSVFYVHITDDAGIGPLAFESNDPADGYGIDNMTIALARNVPEAPTVVLFGMMLFGLAIGRSRGL